MPYPARAPIRAFTCPFPNRSSPPSALLPLGGRDRRRRSRWWSAGAARSERGCAPAHAPLGSGHVRLAGAASVQRPGAAWRRPARNRPPRFRTRQRCDRSGVARAVRCRSGPRLMRRGSANTRQGGCRSRCHRARRREAAVGACRPGRRRRARAARAAVHPAGAQARAPLREEQRAARGPGAGGVPGSRARDRPLRLLARHDLQHVRGADDPRRAPAPLPRSHVGPAGAARAARPRGRRRARRRGARGGARSQPVARGGRRCGRAVGRARDGRPRGGARVPLRLDRPAAPRR